MVFESGQLFLFAWIGNYCIVSIHVHVALWGIIGSGQHSWTSVDSSQQVFQRVPEFFKTLYFGGPCGIKKWIFLQCVSYNYIYSLAIGEAHSFGLRV